MGLAEAEAEAEAAEGAARSCRNVGETPAPPNAAGAEELDMERESPARGRGVRRWRHP